MSRLLFILLAFGPFFIFMFRGLLQAHRREELTLEGVQVFFHWFISLILLTLLIKLVGMSLGWAVAVVVVHHLIWVLVAYYGRETSWRFVKDKSARLREKYEERKRPKE
jgi:hypothetical protein